MWRFTVGLFAVVGLLFVIAAIGGGIAAYSVFLSNDPPPPPERMILRLDLRSPIVDSRPNGGDLQSLFGDQPLTLYELEQALERAAADPRVVGAAARFGGDVFSLSTATEIEAAVSRFKASGKPTAAYADTFGAPGDANASYMVASAFDRIILRSIGSVGLTGVAAQPIFAGPALENLGATAQFVRTGPYKTFPEMLTGDSMSEEHREMLDSILESSVAVLANTVAENRGLAPRDVAALIDAGPLAASAAQDGGLVDTLGGEGALDDRLEAWFGGDVVQISPRDYLELPPAADGGEEQADGPAAARVALVHAGGVIVERSAEGGPAGDPIGFMAANEIAAAIDDITQDGSFDGLILRLNTGGGSAIGSEMVAEALVRARNGGVATVVSMGEAAASGGYWVAVHADRIVATPTTLTGSIGVFSGKVSFGALGERLGVTVETVERGRNAAMWSLATPFAPHQEEWLQAHADDLYNVFVDRVADGRHMPRLQVVDLAGGRVWTGLQAVDLDLVDSLGGLPRAVAELRDLLDLEDDARVEIAFAPEPRDFFDDLWETIRGNLPIGGARSLQPAAGPLSFPLAAALQPLEPILPYLLQPESVTLHMPFAPAL